MKTALLEGEKRRRSEEEGEEAGELLAGDKGKGEGDEEQDDEEEQEKEDDDYEEEDKDKEEKEDDRVGAKGRVKLEN